MVTLNVIRRCALRDQMSIREISRRTGLARNTVKKYLRSEESEPKRVSSSKLNPYAEKLGTRLAIEATKSRKQRRTLRQIHTDSAQKGEKQELIHIVSTFCSKRVWVKIRWKTRVRLQRNSTPTQQAISNTAWYSALEATGIKDFRFHDLRHIWASWHRQAGTSCDELKDLGGWKSRVMIDRYAKYATEHLAVAANRIQRVSDENVVDLVTFQ